MTVEPVQKPSELARLLRMIEECVTPVRVIVEIGVDQGGTFLALAKRFPDAYLIGIDVGRGRWSSGDTLDDPRVIIGNSHHAKTLRRLTKRLDGRAVDVLIIDGDHSLEGVAKDYWTYVPLVRAGGLVALHDIREHPRSWGVHVGDFWRRVKHRHPNAVEIVNDDDERWGGFAAFIVREE